MNVKLAMCLIALSGVAMTSPKLTHAAVYKCVDASGSTTYSQIPCPVEEKTAKVLATSSQSKSYDCRIANNFARRTAIDMRLGMSPDAAFSQYGGLDAIPRTSIGVINYVYTYKNNSDVDTQRIAALSAARCGGGAYGRVSCDDFPYNFVSALGGCEAAAQNHINRAGESNPGSAGSVDAHGRASNQVAERTTQQSPGSNINLDAESLGIDTDNGAECGGVQQQLNALLTGKTDC